MSPQDATTPVPLRPVEDLTVRWLLAYEATTRDAYARDLRAWVAWCADQGVAPLLAERAHVDAYAGMLRDAGLAAATVARRLASLSSWYGYGLADGRAPANPVRGVRRPRGDAPTSTGLSSLEVAVLLTEAHRRGPADELLVCLLGLNGLRVSEALGIAVEDVATERQHRVVGVTRKGGRRAVVPLAPRTARAVDELVEGLGSGPLLRTRSGRPMTRVTAWRRLRRVGEVLPDGGEGLHPHLLRHAFVTLALDAGVALRDVQDAAGHADPRTTRRYDRARHSLDRHPTYAVARSVGGIGS